MQVSLSESMDKVLSYQLCLVKLISQSDKFNAFKPASNGKQTLSRYHMESITSYTKEDQSF